MKSGADVLLGAVKEEALLQQVTAYARLRNWRLYHTRNSQRSAAGFPDLVMVRGDRLVFAELKTMRGVVSLHQAGWLGALLDVRTVESYLWRPNCWEGRDGIEEVLT